MSVCPSLHLPVSTPTFPIITGAALADSINPCAMAVLLILLEALILTGGKSKAIKTGFSFIFGLFLAYFLFGLGLFSALSFLRYAAFLHKIIGGLAILIGLLNIKDFFFYEKGFLMEIPRAWRPRLGGIIHKATSPFFAFLIGFVVCLFELPCTGGPYIFFLGYLASLPKISIVPILIYYNLIFVLPLILITLLIYFGYSSAEKATEWKEKNVKLLHLIAGIIMLALGIWVLLS